MLRFVTWEDVAFVSIK